MSSEDNYVIPKPRKGNLARKWSPLVPSDVDYDGEGNPMYQLVCFDPGGTTGWAVFGVWWAALRSDKYKLMDNVDFWSCGQFTGTEREQADQMLALAGAWPEAYLLIEDFILRTADPRRHVLSPVRLTARFEQGLVERKDDREIILQMPSLAMSTITDERMKIINPEFISRTAGQPHARDTIRHALTWLRRVKEINTIRTTSSPEGIDQ